MTRRTWAVIGGLLTVLGFVQGCSAPTIPGRDGLVLGADGKQRSQSGEGDDAPEGTNQGNIELGQDTKSSEPPPDADRTKSDDGANDAPASVECTADYDCDYGTICIAAKCIDGCYTSYDCPIGQGCTAGKCAATTTSSPPPPSGTGGSGTPCTSDGQCNPGLNGSGEICSAQGTCVTGCHRDNQCPGVKICVTGMCR
jgi:hypothetical protein